MKDGIEYIKNIDTPKKITEAEVIANVEDCWLRITFFHAYNPLIR